MEQGSARLSVLMADDHRLVAEALAAILAREFDLIGIVDDGEALIEAAEIAQPDVIVSDIGMPGLNGIEALSALRAVAPSTRVVILTMHRTSAYAEQAFRAGAAAYVLKSAASAELVEAVRSAGRGETWIPPHIAELLDANAPDAPGRSPDMLLTPRQREILAHLANGLSAKRVGARLNISPRTVEFHKYRMMEVLGVSSTAELIRHGLKSGIIDA